jgi:hypothetical protein
LQLNNLNDMKRYQIGSTEIFVALIIVAILLLVMLSGFFQ